MIRKASIDDAINIYNLDMLCFNRHYSLETIKSDLSNDKVLIFVFEKNNNIVGYISVYYFMDEANLQKIAVIDSERRKGVATQLINYAIQELLKENVVNFYLEVNENNLIAINVYEKLGFEKVSIRNNYYGNESAIIFEKKLD